MDWVRQPDLNNKFIRSAMVWHRNRLFIMGNQGRSNDTSKVEWLGNQFVQFLSSKEGRCELYAINYAKDPQGQWSAGIPYPLTVERPTMVSKSEYIYVFGKLGTKITKI